MYPGQQYLNEGQHQALEDAAVVLIDHCLEEVASLWRDGESAGTLLDDEDVLPPRFRGFYDIQFAKSFLAVLMTVAWKVRTEEFHQPGCVAEEMALDAVIRNAVWTYTELWGLEEHEDYSDEDNPRITIAELADYAFDDRDFELLWSAPHEGLEDTDIGAYMGLGNLRFAEWFEPFTGRLVHPFAWEGPNVPDEWSGSDH